MHQCHRFDRMLDPLLADETADHHPSSCWTWSYPFDDRTVIHVGDSLDLVNGQTRIEHVLPLAFCERRNQVVPVEVGEDLLLRRGEETIRGSGGVFEVGVVQ